MANKIEMIDNLSNLCASQEADEMKLMLAESEGEEDVSLREENVKHFDMGGNRKQAIVYAAPVHYREPGSNEWKEIDNTLEEVTNAHGRRVMRNRSNRVKMEFLTEADGGNMASITDGEHTFGWSLDADVNTFAHVVRTGAEMKLAELVAAAQRLPGYVGRTVESLQAADLEHEIESAQDRRASIAKLRAENAYNNVRPGINVRYSLNGEAMKEDIIVASAEALASAALRLPKSYNYSVTEDMRLLVLDPATDDLRFSMSTPIVFDAAGAEAMADIVLTDKGDYVRLAYILPDEFIRKAVFPVTIDPVVQTATTNEAVCDSYIWAKNPNTNYGSVHLMRCGDGDGGESISLIKFNKLIKLRASDTVLSAQLRVTAKNYPSDPEIMGCYPIKTSWTENSVTWNSMTPTNDTHISKDLIAYIPATTPTYCYFDITSQYRDWYLKNADGTSRNYGVALRYPPEVTSGGNYVEWTTTQYDSSKGPCMVVNYISHAGRKGWWQYESMSAGRAGTAFVDLYNGNLVYEHEDGGTTGNRMPVSLKHVYNSCLSESNPVHCGKGWRTSMHQSVCKKTLSGTGYYIWTDGDATEHYFRISDSQPYEDMEGMSLKLSTSDSTLTITDKEHVVLTFPLPADTTQQYLTKISDSMGNRAELTYASGKLSTIKDGVDRVIQFTYNTAGYLSQLTIPSRPTLTFTYTGDNLTGIGYSDVSSGTTMFTYEADSNMLVAAKNFDGMQVNMIFEGEDSYDTACIDSYAKQVCRVISLEQLSGDLKGAKQLFDYQHQTTKVTAVETANSDAGKVLTYQFNTAGNVVCCYDELGYAQSSLYSSSIANQQTGASRLKKVVINKMTNIDFSSGWTATKGATADTVAQDTSIRCLNMPSVKVTKTTSAETCHSQTVNIDTTGRYTFSAYVKNTTALVSGKLFLRVKAGSKVYESRGVTGLTAAFNTDSAADGWDRLYITANVATAGDVTLELVSTAPTSSAWFACPQFEPGSIANHVNLLLNGDFTRTTTNDSQTFASNWSKSSGISTNVLNGVVLHDSTGMPEGLTGNAMRIHSYCNTGASSHCQSIAAKGKKGDVFVIGGWVNATSVASGGNHFKACIISRFKDTSGTWSSWQYNEYDVQRVGWKFAEWAIVAPSDYQEFRIGIQYARNTGTAMFTNVFIHREEFGQSFAYDDKKNLISVANLSTQKSGMEYDDADNLKSYRQPGAASTVKYTMNYGSTAAQRKQHLLKESSTPMGQRDVFTHDSYGNVKTETRQKSGDTAFIKILSDYTDDGNYKKTTTDTRGYIVEQTVNTTDGTLTQVKDPNNQEVNYTYDNAKRITKVETQADGKTYRNVYSYDKDRIKTVGHNTTDNLWNDVIYNFGYDELGRKTTVKIGSNTLSTNVYNSDRNGLLKEVQYGNGGKVEYQYDEFDRPSAVIHDGIFWFHHSYEYDAAGRPAVINDFNANRTVQKEYDLCDRLMGEQIRDSNENVIYRTEMDYDGQNRLVGFGETVEDASYKTSYTYDNDNRVTEIGFGGNDKVKYTYDNVGRMSGRIVENGTDDGKVEAAYTFVSGGHGDGSTTPLVEKIDRTQIPFEYTYDSRGNIKTEKRGNLTTSYEYDAIGQLIRVNDPHENKTWVYEYDRGGNMTKRVQYAYTEDALGDPVATRTYGYNPQWKDQLTANGSYPLTYDAIGNLKTYGGWEYEWEAGRQLVKQTQNEKVVAYDYDYNGMRIRQTVSNKTSGYVYATYNYTYSGTKLVHMTVYNDDLHFFYDNQGRPAKVKYNGEMYTYLHNLQGDIVGIVDSSGALVVEYKYNAWGTIVSKSGSMATTLGHRNPFRYRGYIYDEETWMYWLKSRYYYPELHRFICPDNVFYLVEHNALKNAYAYCNLRPINLKDPTGYIPEDAADELIRANAQFIIDAAEEFNIDPQILAGVIYTEQVLNVDWIDTCTDWLGCTGIIDTSIGISQVKMSTALSVEEDGLMERTTMQYNKLGVVATENQLRWSKLCDNQTNIRYAAAYLRQLTDAWKPKYDVIEKSPSILGTLYNIGVGKPHSEPKPTNFGRKVGEVYKKMKGLLGL